ncbi:hypothetical protein N7466_006615 [Penicillium verhagenii]|uniref:uncharacterized protein n=1 Tax=Penicillium verhagenii TaxID=1562060 RepID=UPI0025455E9D|nr:uncharacterized protein N7466_006615 [Penicillium verhagenii]KAJ5931122.1 hypothetical protein N7466_006615 [Penicillium verhagenii]
MAHIPPAKVTVQGPHNESEPDHKSHLQEQLQSISSTVTHLLVDNDTPSNTEWDLLGAHFKQVENLQLESGFNEELNDKNIPLHWPLKNLELGSACGELIQSPFIRQGLVQRLKLYFTCNLRFEGPTTSELYDTHSEAVSRGKIEGEYMNGEGDKKIEITYLPELVCNHMSKIYSDPDRKLDPENEPPTGPISLQTLEIWENDAIDTFCRMFGALPHLVDNLHTLQLRSTSGLDFSLIGEETFRQLLPAMTNLKVLNLTVGDVFQDPTFLPMLHKILPPNLRTLYFRAPASLTKSDHWADWLQSFQSSEFLPHLKHLAFVLDLYYKPNSTRSFGKEETEAPLDLLLYARQECQTLYDVAQKRGIHLEVMPKEPDFALLRPVDSRW